MFGVTDRDAVLDDLVAIVEQLRQLGYLGAVEVRPDASVVFHLAEDDPVVRQRPRRPWVRLALRAGVPACVSRLFGVARATHQAVARQHRLLYETWEDYGQFAGTSRDQVDYDSGHVSDLDARSEKSGWITGADTVAKVATNNRFPTTLDEEHLLDLKLPCPVSHGADAARDR